MVTFTSGFEVRREGGREGGRVEAGKIKFLGSREVWYSF